MDVSRKVWAKRSSPWNNPGQYIIINVIKMGNKQKIIKIFFLLQQLRIAVFPRKFTFVELPLPNICYL